MWTAGVQRQNKKKKKTPKEKQGTKRQMLKGKSWDRNTADNLTMKVKDGLLKVHKTIV